MLTETKKPLWDRDPVHVFVGYAIAESIAIAILKNFGFISIVFSVLGISVHPVFIHAWFWGMVVFVVFYIAFKFNMIKRANYIWDEFWEGNSVLEAAHATLDHQARLVLLGVLTFYVLLVLWLLVVM